MPGDDVAGILHLIRALEHRLAEVADWADNPGQQADDQTVGDHQLAEERALRDEHTGHRAGQAADESFPCLVRTDRGKKFSLAEAPADEEGSRVVAPGG